MRIIITHTLHHTSGSQCWVQIKITWGFFPKRSCWGFIHIKSKSLGEIQALVYFQSLLEVFNRRTKWRTMVLDKGRKKSSILAWICLDSIVKFYSGICLDKFYLSRFYSILFYSSLVYLSRFYWNFYSEVSYKKRNAMTSIRQQHFGIIYSMCMIYKRQNIFLSFQLIWIPEQKDLNWSFSALPATHRHTQ